MTEERKNWLEWAVFGVSSLLTLGTIGYLLYASWAGGGAPPELEVRLGEPEPRPGHYALPVRVLNRGDKAAGQVRVEVVLRSRGGGRERATFLIQYLPGGAERNGWVAFTTDPAAAESLTARPVGYEQS